MAGGRWPAAGRLQTGATGTGTCDQLPAAWEPVLQGKAVCIIGLGLMGGSLGMALRGKCHAVWGVARRVETVQAALDRGAIDFGTVDLGEGLRQADLVVLAVPVRGILAMIPQVAPLLRPGAMVMDLGSTKAEIAAALEAGLPPGVQAIGGHPMCGKETSGLQWAQADLYRGKVFVLTPLQRTTGEALVLAEAIVQSAGACPLVMDADRHDRLVAAISHLPYLESLALAEVAQEVARADTAVWQLSAAGFRDASRLAASDVTMMADILLTNRVNVSALARRAAQRLASLAQSIEDADEPALRQRMQAARDSVSSQRVTTEAT